MFGFGGRNQGRADGGNEHPIEKQARNIDNILDQIGLNPNDIRMDTDEGYGWSFRRGSAVVEIYLSVQEGVGYLQVLSPIIHIPTEATLPLYRRLLELNLTLTSAALGLYNDVVYVFYERPIEGLDAVEANDIITKVAGYADDLDDQLVEEFGGRLYMQT
ncbi:MAG: YbjN domain-containing protein [Chloroflexota bacterium]